MADLIDRQMTIDALCKSECGWNNAECRHKDDTDFCVTCDNVKIIKLLPSAQPEQHEIGYSECANAMLKMWIDKVLTDGEYNRIMDKLNAHWAGRSKNHVNVNT